MGNVAEIQTKGGGRVEDHNTSLWNAVEKTPPSHTKKITGKPYQGTSPRPHHLVFKATETFGPCGIGWGFTIEDERIEEGAGGEKMHFAKVRVWYIWQGKRGEVEHVGGTQFSGMRGSGKSFTDEDAPKKSVTDALVKALSMIGFAGDIFMGRYDDSKYVAEVEKEERSPRAEARPARQERQQSAPQQSSKADSRDTYARLSEANAGLESLDKHGKFWNQRSVVEAFAGLPKDWQATLAKERDAKRVELEAEADPFGLPPIREDGAQIADAAPIDPGAFLDDLRAEFDACDSLDTLDDVWLFRDAENALDFPGDIADAKSLYVQHQSRLGRRV